MITITIMNAAGDILRHTEHPTEALLRVDRVYEEGDVILITCDTTPHLIVQPEVTLLPAEVFLPQGRMTWRVPAGEHRMGYSTAAFTSARAIVTARVMTDAEVRARRNVALNPADLRGDTDFFPHATANVETRNESTFAARNVIDGLRFNDHHGRWPFQSWGIGTREDACCTIDFGRDVMVDEMALTLRADFPHDAHWTQGHVILSDGTDIAFDLQKTGERQYIPLGSHTVRWMRLERLVKSDDPSAFPALTEWEIFGADV